MKVFHELAYQGYVLVDPGGGVAYHSDPRLQELIGAVDALHVSGYSTQVTGTTPQLTISIEYSSDRHFWRAVNFPTPVIDASLSTSGETLFQGTEPLAPLARLAYGRLRIALSGTNGQAFLRIWVTGRDRSRRSAGNGGSGGRPPMARPMPKMPNGMNGLYGPKH